VLKWEQSFFWVVTHFSGPGNFFYNSIYSGRRRTFGVNGLKRSGMPACSGVRLAFFSLHRRQALTRLSQAAGPPSDCGST